SLAPPPLPLICTFRGSLFFFLLPTEEEEGSISTAVIGHSEHSNTHTHTHTHTHTEPNSSSHLHLCSGVCCCASPLETLSVSSDHSPLQCTVINTATAHFAFALLDCIS